MATSMVKSGREFLLFDQIEVATLLVLIIQQKESLSPAPPPSPSWLILTPPHPHPPIRWGECKYKPRGYEGGWVGGREGWVGGGRGLT